MLKFRSTILLNNINPYIHVSAARAAQLKPGWRRPLPVCVQINGQPQKPWRINMMPMGDGGFYLYLHGTVRQASGSRVGDRVQVSLSFDAEYRGGPEPMPAWFSKPLSKNKRASMAWRALSPSRKKEVIRYLTRLKSDEARRRNVDKALQVLSGHPARFMGRAWLDGA